MNVNIKKYTLLPALATIVACALLASLPFYAYAITHVDVSVGAEVSAEAKAKGSAENNGDNMSDNEGRANAEAKMDVGAEMKAQNASNGEDADEEGDGEEAQRNESNLEFAGRGVSASAVEVRGWDPEQKQQFLATVKTHAQVQSEQDLENFAKGVLVQDENVEAVISSEEEVEVKYRVPAKFLGIFNTTLPATVTVEAQGEGSTQSSVSERVKAKFPWLRIFFSISEDVREEALEEAVLSQVSADIESDTQFETAQQARLFELISSVLKVKNANAVDAAAAAEAGVE